MQADMQKLEESQMMMTCRSINVSDRSPHFSQEVEERKGEDYHEDMVEEYRMILPALKPPGQKVSVWKVIKDAIGKDLSRFCVPVYFNEPVSML
jgi:hypothetical protein